MADGGPGEPADHPDRTRFGGGAHKAGAFSISLFLFAALLFLPPIVTLGEGIETVFGLPRTFIYLFAAWIAVVFLAYLIAERVAAPNNPPQAGKPEG